jgi:DNA-binding transcriptional regulator PaaX
MRRISDTAYETIFFHLKNNPMSSIVGTSKHTGYSYGTVRAAVAQMVTEGAIVRNRIRKGSQAATYANMTVL